MKKGFVILFFVCALCTAVICTAAPPDSDYTLVLDEEFNGTELNTDIWGYRGGNKAGGYNRPENVRVADGKLYLDYKIVDGVYTCGGILTNAVMPYGYYETKAKLFGDTGAFHSSFWLAGGSGFITRPENFPLNNTMLEIDGFEVDSERPSYISYGTHYWWADHQSIYRQGYDNINTSAQWFTMGMEWLPDRVNFYVDGNLIGTHDTINVYQQCYLWLTALAMPEGKAHLIDESKVDGSSMYEYFKYYQKPLKGVNLLGNGNFEYDRCATSTIPFCYVIKGDTDAAYSYATPFARSGQNCLAQHSNKPYSVSTGQEFAYLLPGNYMFKGFFKASEGLTTAKMVVRDKQGNVLSEKPIPAGDAWHQVICYNVPVTDYAYVSIESSSDVGGTYLLADDLEFYINDGVTYTASNSPNYNLYNGADFRSKRSFNYSKAVYRNGSWSDSSLGTGYKWASNPATSALIRWEVAVDQDGTYYLENYNYVNSGNVAEQYYTVYINGDTEHKQRYTLNTRTGETGWTLVCPIENLHAGDTVTIEQTFPGTGGIGRITEFFLSHGDEYNMYRYPTLKLGYNLFSYRNKAFLFDNSDFSLVPYEENGVYYIPYQGLNAVYDLGMTVPEGTVYVTSQQIESQTNLHVTVDGSMLFIHDGSSLEINRNILHNILLLLNGYKNPFLISNAYLIGTEDVFNQTAYPFTDATVQGTWQSSGIWGGNQYSSSNNASVQWGLLVPATGRYSVQVFSPTHDNSTSSAKVTLVTTDEYGQYYLDQKNAAAGWYTLGNFDLSQNDLVSVTLTRDARDGFLRASKIRLVPVGEGAALFESNSSLVLDMGEDYTSCGTILYAEYDANGSLAALQQITPQRIVTHPQTSTPHFKFFFWSDLANMIPLGAPVTRN